MHNNYFDIHFWLKLVDSHKIKRDISVVLKKQFCNISLSKGVNKTRLSNIAITPQLYCYMKYLNRVKCILQETLSTIGQCWNHY